MFRSIQSVLFSLLLVVAFTSCEKEVSEENGSGLNSGGTQSGTAVYTLDGAPLLCTTPIISGDYVVGTALDISNSVVITVNVTTVGTYTISTGLINGIQFVGTGTFPGTGPQAITLFGTGTPLAAMSSNYIPGTSGCTFVVTATTAVITPVGGLYYEATIGTTHYRVDVDGLNGYEMEVTNAGSDDVVSGSVITTSVQPRPANKTSLAVEKGIIHGYLSASNLTFKTFFTPSAYPYGTFPSDGILITWGDEGGADWTTTGDQTGSNFTIVSVADEPGQTDYTVRVTATFNCKLYNGASTKTVTGGNFVGLFSKF